jgi:hypothetical protein
LLEAENDRAHPTAETVASGLEVQRFLQCRAGRSYDVSLAMPTRDLVLTYKEAHTASEDAYVNARCLLTMRCLLEAGGAISLEFVPEVEHGPLRQKWVAKGGTFHAESGRDRDALDRLSMTLNVRPGETVLITGNSAAGNLGSNFFVHPETNRQRLLLVRLAQTHTQDLYSSEELAPLTTAGE